MDVDQLLRQPEGKTLERKRDLSSPRAVLRTLVAFANSAGGRILLGVADDGSAVGLLDPLAVEQRLANLVADSIEPRLLPELLVVPWRRKQLLVVEVHPSPLRPHHLLADGPERGTYVRLGSTNRIADADLVQELRRRVHLGSYDEQPLPELDCEAIDFAAASQSFAQRRRLRRQDLASLGLLTTHQGRAVPTVGGVVLFGVERLVHVPDAWIQVGRFAGTDRSRIEDRAELRQHPIEAIEAAVAFVERSTRLGASIGAVRRTDHPALPPVALREALVNAVVHADYAQRGAPIRVAVFDDRVEIENPGILLPGLTLDELRDGVSRLRNRVIGRVFKELGLVEQWGSGVQRMIRACLDAGLPAPVFTEIGFRFRVVLGTIAVAPAATNETEARLLAFLQGPSGRSTAEIAAHLGLSARAAQMRLRALAQNGLVVAVGSSPRDPRRRWFLGPRAAAGAS